MRKTNKVCKNIILFGSDGGLGNEICCKVFNLFTNNNMFFYVTCVEIIHHI